MCIRDRAVSVAELSLQGNGTYLHVLVGVGAEAFFRENRVVVEYAQGSELDVYKRQVRTVGPVKEDFVSLRGVWNSRGCSGGRRPAGNKEG